MPRPRLPQSAFDGTWHTNIGKAKISPKPNVFYLSQGWYHCVSCNPAYDVKADGTDQPVTGQTYDTVSRGRSGSQDDLRDNQEGGQSRSTNRPVGLGGRQALTVKIHFPSHEQRPAESPLKPQPSLSVAPSGVHATSGSWQIDKIKSKRQRARHVTYKTSGDEITMTEPTGESYTAKLDGTDAPYKGSYTTDTVSIKKIDAHTIEETDKRGGEVVEVDKMTVSANGKTMTMVANEQAHGPHFHLRRNQKIGGSETPHPSRCQAEGWGLPQGPHAMPARPSRRRESLHLGHVTSFQPQRSRTLFGDLDHSILSAKALRLSSACICSGSELRQFSTRRQVSPSSRPCSIRIERWRKCCVHLGGMAFFFHFVSVVEMLVAGASLVPVGAREVESLLGFAVAGLFFLVWWLYDAISLGIFALPVTFFLVFVPALGLTRYIFPSQGVRTSWLVAHIVGAAAGLCGARLQPAGLGALPGAGAPPQSQDARPGKTPGGRRSTGCRRSTPWSASPTPALVRLSLHDRRPGHRLRPGAGDVAGRSLFPRSQGHRLLCHVGVYVLLLFLRRSAGLRGRKAAYLSGAVLVVMMAVWAANLFSHVHRFGAPMTLALIGVNHKTAPIALRERIAISPRRAAGNHARPGRRARRGRVHDRLHLQPRGAAGRRRSRRDADLTGFLHRHFGLDPAVLAPHIYEHHDQDAVRHLFRVAASLDSMVVGEPQILGQVKEAFAVARAAGTVGGQLEHLLQSAFAAAKTRPHRNRNRLELRLHRIGRRRSGAQDLRLAQGPHGLPGRRGQNERAGRAAPGAAGRRRHPGHQPHRGARAPHGRGVSRPRHSRSSSSMRPPARPTSSSAPPARRIPSSAASTGRPSCIAAATGPCSSSISPCRATSIRR